MGYVAAEGMNTTDETLSPTVKQTGHGYCLNIERKGGEWWGDDDFCSTNVFHEAEPVSALFPVSWKYKPIPGIGIELPLSTHPDFLTNNDYLSINVYPFPNAVRSAHPEFDFGLFFLAGTSTYAALSGSRIGPEKFIDPVRGILLSHLNTAGQHFFALTALDENRQLRIIEAQLFPDNPSKEAVENALQMLRSVKLRQITPEESAKEEAAYLLAHAPEAPQNWMWQTTDDLPLEFLLPPGIIFSKKNIPNYGLDFLSMPGSFEPAILSYYTIEQKEGDTPTLTTQQERYGGSSFDVITMRTSSSTDPLIEEICYGSSATFAAPTEDQPWTKLICNYGTFIFRNGDTVVLLRASETDSPSVLGERVIMTARANPAFDQGAVSGFFEWMMSAFRSLFGNAKPGK